MTVDAGVRSFDVSPYPEEKYVAAGTEKGTIHIFLKEHLVQKKPYKYCQINPHTTWVRGINFIKAGDDYLMTSFSEAGHIHLFCLRERQSLYYNDQIPNGVLNMIYSDRINSLIINTKKHQFLRISLDFDDEYFKNYKD